MEVLHDWDDENAVRILRAVRAAARPQSRLLVVETLVAEEPGPHLGTLRDIIMLAVTGGRERTQSQFAALLHGHRFSARARAANDSAVFDRRGRAS